MNGNIGVEVLVQGSRISYVKITEDARHVELFHGQLGKLLEEAKAEREAVSAAP